MGYEVPASIGVKLADPTREVFAMVGDGGYLMMPTELVTAVQERLKVIVVLVQNHGFHSIGSLSESLGSQRFGTSYRMRGEASRRLDGERAPGGPRRERPQPGLPRHRGPLAVRARGCDRRGSRPAAGGRPVVIHVETDPLVFAPDSESWWDVPVSEVSRARVHRRGPLDLTPPSRPPNDRSSPRPPRPPRGPGDDARGRADRFLGHSP